MNNAQWENKTANDLIKQLDSNADDGLKAAEAAKRLAEYGKNAFDQEKKDSLVKRIFHYLSEITAIILLIAAAIAAYIAITEDDGWAKVIVILAIVIINTTLALYQENKAEQALEALKKMNTAKTTVMRDGKKVQIEADHLVPGDIVILTAGDVITADARLIEASNLEIDESSLTGESEPVAKDPRLVLDQDVTLGDRLNMVYSGCLVTAGRGRALVVATGMQTEMGKIAGLLSTTKKLRTPLQLRLHGLAKRLSLVALGAGALMFLIGILVHGNDLPDMLLIGVSLGVAAVPETLPIIVTIILSVSVHSMVTRKAIIRRVAAIETIGNTSVICSDKTGTLTENRMTIQQLWQTGSDPIKSIADLNADQNFMLALLAANCDAHLEYDNHGKEKIIGDPTEAAIVRLADQKDITPAYLKEHYPRVHEIPFDSSRKLMTTVHKVDDGYISVTKGAFDRIPANWSDNEKQSATRIHDEFASRALRVIAVGYKKYSELPTALDKDDLENELESNLTFLGLVGMIDPPRPESKIAVAAAAAAGIKTVMITGDHLATATAIAQEIGIYHEGDRALTGDDLSRMNDDELFKTVRNISVYARVSPEDKIRIVKAWEAHGEVITMTGDGVNDAPALKAADVGAAMGITGTEVSKNAADMIIADDNFATIVDAIHLGRVAYDNIRKTVYFLLSVNFAQIFIMLSGMIIWGYAPIIAVQILLINVISDGLPGFFLAFEKAEKGIMGRKPLPKNAGIFADHLGFRIAQRAATFFFLTMTAFFIGRFIEIVPHVTPSPEIGISMAFITLSWASVINIFNVRSSESIFKIGFFSNKGIFISSIASIGITVAVALVPFLASIFHVVPLSLYHWLIVIGLASLQLITCEIQKLLTRPRYAERTHA